MDWVTLITKLPRSRTTALKVATWRKLKRLGVYTLQDSVYVLPRTERALEAFQWIAAEIREGGGDASVWEMSARTEAREREMRDFFLEHVNAQYRSILEEVRGDPDEATLRQLWGLYHKVKAQDYLRSPLSAEARAACERRARALLGEPETGEGANA
ncbi:MAG: Chromate resistance protein ChrB [Syntrophobacteraceae bacterium]